MLVVSSVLFDDPSATLDVLSVDGVCVHISPGKQFVVSLIAPVVSVVASFDADVSFPLILAAKITAAIFAAFANSGFSFATSTTSTSKFAVFNLNA